MHLLNINSILNLIIYSQLGNAIANAKRIQYVMAYLAPLPHTHAVVRQDMKCKAVIVSQ